MRTREEQIAHLSCAIFNEKPGDIDNCISLAREYILEAERLAEQRVRAEIGRDSERLDWVADNQCQFENYGMGEHPLRVVNDCMGDKLASSYDLREAIDAAREVG
ncbi:hypothetical protein [Acetobacter senegalensis]|uniref:hypothetical protein n=1 Tax=Acetobacter senegalensis TaxID=446692 RepID=UPI002652D3C8|nr:hypothetical protein [Acetobacter senegalensis]MDN7356358.1 hypothetical protein [Acetobacter senegalensis]